MKHITLTTLITNIQNEIIHDYGTLFTEEGEPQYIMVWFEHKEIRRNVL